MKKKLKIQNSKLKTNLPKPLAIQPEELEILSPRKKLTVSECALQRRILSSKTSNFAGPWSHYYTPWAVEIMDFLSDIGTKQETVMKSVQSAGSEIGLNFLDWIIEESPGPTLIAMPREDDTNRRINTRIKPMFAAMPSLRSHLPGGKIENINIGKETVLDNMILFIGWAGSAAAMADNPVCYVWLDEVGKFPLRTGKEADPVSLAKDRQVTFFSRSKLLIVSSPVNENDLIDREFKAGDRREWWVACPFCGDFHVMANANLQLDKDNDGNLLDSQQYLTGKFSRYVCPLCRKAWSEKDRWQAVSDGVWAPDGCTVDKNGKIIGKIPITVHHSHHISGFMLYPGFQTIARLSAKRADAIFYKKIGDIGPMQDYINSYLGEPFEEREKETSESVLISHIGSHKPEIVPSGVQMIAAGFDVQLDHVYARVLGWGYMSEVWSIFEARLETGDTSQLENFRMVEELLEMQWPFEDDKGHTMGIYKAGIDCNYRGDVVFDFCRRHSDVLIPVRGDDSVRSRVFRASKVAGSLIRYDLNVNVIKDRLYRLLFESIAAGPGYFHLHAETSADTLEQLASEEQRRIRNGRHFDNIWVKKDRNKANHFWDCDVYATFAAEIAGVRMLREPSQSQPADKHAEIEKQGSKKIRTKY